MGVTASSLLVRFATEINRRRALTDEESAQVAKAIHRSSRILKRWTRQEDETLVMMRREGRTDRQIAVDMGRSLFAVRSRLRDKRVRKSGRDLRA